MTATQDATIAELQRANAELRQELAARNAELAQRNSEYSERIEQQTATIDVLKVMSASPGDPQPAFDLIVSRARDLCDGYGATVYGFDGTLIHWRAATGVTDDPSVREAVEAMYPMAPSREWPVGRAIMDRQIIHISDLDKEPGLNPTTRAVRTMGVRSTVAIPLLRGEQAIGVIAIGSSTVGGFSDGQIALLQTFAEQAVIAITSAETYRALQTRTSDLQETLEYQTATSDLLKVISRSTFDLQPVLATVAETAARLCDADQAAIYRREGESARLVANFGFPPEYETYTRALGAFPIDPNAVAVGQRTLVEGRPVHVHDVAAVPGYWEIAITLGKQRTSLGVPLLREGETIGNIMLARQRVEPFTDRQIQLVSTFADQAVIAIENTRLLTEQKEALEQQTATAEVLQVINGSLGELTPVFDTILEKATRLCDARRGQLATFDGEYFRFVAVHGDAGFSEAQFTQGAVRPEIGVTWARIVAGEQVVHMVDVVDTDLYRAGHEGARRFVDVGGGRTLLTVALRKDDLLLGALTVYRQEVRAFTDKHIELLRSFAAQAVIAMENARLLTEQRDALEQQTATAEVLGVINASPGNLAPVLDAMLEKAMRLCDAAFGDLLIYNSETFHRAAMQGVTPAMAEFLREPIHPESEPGSALYRIVHGENILHQADITDDEVYRSGLRSRRILADLMGARTRLMVALRKDDILLGVFNIFRQEVRPFSDKQIALLENFAAQAVIAMENARLLTEQQEALEQQTATSEVLQVINASPGHLAPVFDAMLEKAMRLCDGAQGTLWMFDGERMCASATAGYSSELAEQLSEWREIHPFQRRLSQGERVFQIVDLAAEELYHLGNPLTRAAVDVAGIRTVVFVALVKDAATLGGFTISRREVRAFSDKHISLLQNFAEQAVIAIENARLIDEQREALEQQTATAEVLQVINASPGNLVPVFDAMLDKALGLCDAAFGILWTYDGTRGHAAALRGVPPEFAEYLTRAPHPVDPGGAHGRLLSGEPIVHIADAAEEQAYRSGNPLRRALVELGRARTLLAVPLRKDNVYLGHFVIYRREVRPFSDKQIALLRNFAAQAVIAMENARLITEQREALEQQTATAEVLQVINASPGNLTPVFEAILEKAHDLCDIAHGDLQLYDGEYLHSVAQRGLSAEFADRLRQGYRASDSPASRPLLAGDRFTHIADAAAVDFMVFRSSVRPDGIRTVLFVPLRKDGSLLGMIASARREVRPFTEKEIALLENFAAQAVIAMENARLLTELQQRTEELARRNSEYGERIDQQSATIGVLEAMSASSGDAQPVFQMIVDRARAFCNADNANLALVDGDMLHVQATTIIYSSENALFMAQFPRPVDATSMLGRAILARDAVQTPDVWVDPQHFLSGGAMPRPRGFVAVPLLRAGAPIGAIVLARNTPGEFSATQVELLRTFAEQAVIAISSADTFKELQRRTADLTRSVAELQALEEVLRAVNSSLELETVLSTIISRAVQLSDADEGTIYEYDVSEQVFVPKSAFGMSAERVAALRERRIKLGQTHLGRSAILRAPVYIEDVQQDPSVPNAGDVLPGIHAVPAVPLLRNDTVIGGLVIRRRTEKGFAKTIITLMQTFSGQAVLAIENARLFQEAGLARTAAEAALVDLRRAQDRLVQSEKMASLGQLTAGIAHEIKNPLNFVNNFAELSVDLLGELKDAIAPAEPALTEKQRAEVEEVSVMLTSNLEKITEHGKRADSIVKAMLEHSRGSSGERRMVDLNTLIDEALNLAYHGARAQDQSFNITLERDFGEGIAPIEVNPQDITRVFLNLFANGFYAVTRRAREGGDTGFVPTLKVTTGDAGEAVEIRVRDNGTGIPADIRDKLFQPFFTTKPTGEGTGLGLSITYDIITQQHGGSITVDSKIGEYSEFTVRLPRNSYAL